jgi:hypothetical protein
MTVVEGSNALTVFALSKIGVVGSNSTRGTDGAFILCLPSSVYEYVQALRRADPPFTDSNRLCIA